MLLYHKRGIITCGNVAQAQVGSHLPSLPASAPTRQQPIQDLLEQPIPSHLQAMQPLTCDFVLAEPSGPDNPQSRDCSHRIKARLKASEWGTGLPIEHAR